MVLYISRRFSSSNVYPSYPKDNGLKKIEIVLNKKIGGTKYGSLFDTIIFS